METMQWLMNWFSQNCDGDWEHNNNISINTLDKLARLSVPLGRDNGMQDRKMKPGHCAGLCLFNGRKLYRF